MAINAHNTVALYFSQFVALDSAIGPSAKTNFSLKKLHLVIQIFEIIFMFTIKGQLKQSCAEPGLNPAWDIYVTSFFSTLYYVT